MGVSLPLSPLNANRERQLTVADCGIKMTGISVRGHARGLGVSRLLYL